MYMAWAPSLPLKLKVAIKGFSRTDIFSIVHVGSCKVRCECHSCSNESNHRYRISRRNFGDLFANVAIASAISTLEPTSTLGVSLPGAQKERLVFRLLQAAPGRPKNQITAKDLFYPIYFAGLWKIRSTLLSVACPAGYNLFGRPGSYEAAVNVS